MLHLPSRVVGRSHQWRMWGITAAALVLYLATLNFARDRVPAGLNNDVAEEALRGVSLLESGRFEAINLFGVGKGGYRYGNSMETLFLYLLGVAARISGTTALSIHVTTWLFALATICLVCWTTWRLDPALPAWLPALLVLSSIWLFHYARSGLRAITAPVFLLSFALLLDQSEEMLSRWRVGLACGAVLGLSLYAYTSCRVLPIAFLIHGSARLWNARGQRRELLHRYAAVAAGLLIVSLPNLILLFRQPGTFLTRGSYVVRGGIPAAAINVMQTLLLPLYYAHKETAVGATNVFDGVSQALAVAGLRPIHPVVAAAFLIGLVRAWRRRGEPLVSFLLAAWVSATIALGISGPSLTRLLILLPFYLVIAALGFGTVLRFRGVAPLVAAALLLMTVAEARNYFVIFAQNPSSRHEYALNATAIGQRARALAMDGARVTCVVAANANVVNFLTHDVQDRVEVLEFMRRPTTTSEIPLMLQFRPQVILLEHDPGLDLFRAAFLLLGRVEARSGFDEFKVDPQLPG